ncbi:hypothetical protein [Bacillus sp. 1P06AnD]|uniref:hypothetical protein n=1 Tax=Bacillus sp. 1P06AnD TaxID=3132208 RepID=UPI0039A358FB
MDKSETVNNGYGPLPAIVECRQPQANQSSSNDRSGMGGNETINFYISEVTKL